MSGLSKVSNIPIYNVDQVTDSIILEKVIVNYNAKTRYMVDDKLKQSDINEFLNFMNYCFLVKNNFFVDDFDINIFKHVYITYNKIKTNILEKNCNNLFEGIYPIQLETIKLIVENLITNYEKFVEVNPRMMCYVSKNGMERFKEFINFKLKLLQQ